jgi:hypothetical protein
MVFFALAMGHAQEADPESMIPPSIDDDKEIPVVREELPVPEEGEEFNVRYFKGVTDGEESRIAIKNLGYILRNTMVYVLSEDGRQLDVKIVKKNWEDIHREGSTKNGEYKSVFSTAMEFGIIVSSPHNGIPFIVAVASGKELFPQSNLFVDIKTMKSVNGNSMGTNSSTQESDIQEESTSENSEGISYKTLFMGLIGLIVVAVVLLFVLKKKNAAIIIGFLTITNLNAGPVLGFSNVLGANDFNGTAKAIVDAFGKEVGSGRSETVLSPDDEEFKPDMDPAGQPSLPTSCVEVAKTSEVPSSSSQSGASTTNMEGGAKNSPVDGTQNDAATDDNTTNDGKNEEGKDEDIEAAMRKAEQDKENGMAEAASTRDAQLQSAAQEYTNELSAISRQHASNLQLANGDENATAEATRVYNDAMGELTRQDNMRRTEIIQQHSITISNVLAEYASEMARLNSKKNEKDNDRQNKKDSDRPTGDKKDLETQNSGKAANDGVKGVEMDQTSKSPETSGGKKGNSGSNGGCKCLEMAYKDLNQLRYKFEKLQKIGQHTKKVADFGMSFGDNFSGIHPIHGLAWQRERAKIMKSLKKLDTSYKNKHAEFTQKLYSILMQIDGCEQMLGEENWYGRYGFVYYEFMKTRYATYK